MPRSVEIDGKQVQVWEEGEHRQAVEAAAAAARREAEGQRDSARQELATAQERVKALEPFEGQAKEAAAKATGLERTLSGMRVLSGEVPGLTPAQAEQILGMPALATVDLGNEEARKAALDGLKATFPGLFEQKASGNGAPGGAAGGNAGGGFGGVGGSPAPGEPTDYAALEKLSMDQYVAWAAKQG